MLMTGDSYDCGKKNGLYARRLWSMDYATRKKGRKFRLFIQNLVTRSTSKNSDNSMANIKPSNFEKFKSSSHIKLWIESGTLYW